ncbi:hypothetical protein Pmani_003537 [Petrolisthes manimaculis]|uniref:Chitin-binding type-2 domain-containing protein n=1 Tax=Petrolisthes manimaculis TaxID=1843537 RepID=A0AAE1QBR2_9EUCA|nr:hypothetical protein Pmani_005933 [Petrolisthes manimaculis]KAK4325967.1 hypothetical protein Pmani_003531 [Petrolisthes manimaculis]KAK4325973.1 hypothetical protein Pmani_003537 [Petrolisthes manimaculis]
MPRVALTLLLVMMSLGVLAATQMAWQFPDQYEYLLPRSELVTSFSCENRPYGYYADVDNDCKIYHICYPVKGFSGEIAKIQHYSFICNNDTIFDQRYLVCSQSENAFPCNEAPSLYKMF